MKPDALFQQIERWQGKENWGSVLDSGTGEHSLEWLLSLPTKKITAITGDQQREKRLFQQFQPQLRSTDVIATGNWLNQSLLEHQSFDVVIADYLLGAIDGFAPYFQHKIFARLRPLCQKHLYVIGQEPFPVQPTSLGGQLIIEIGQLRDACILLAGHRCYREYPRAWVIENLQQNGYHVSQQQAFPISFGKNYILGQLRVCQSKLRYFQDRSLAREMSFHIERTKEKAIDFINKNCTISFGEDYVIQAIPLEKNS